MSVIQDNITGKWDVSKDHKLIHRAETQDEAVDWWKENEEGYFADPDKFPNLAVKKKPSPEKNQVKSQNPSQKKSNQKSQPVKSKTISKKAKKK